MFSSKTNLWILASQPFGPAPGGPTSNAQDPLPGVVESQWQFGARGTQSKPMGKLFQPGKSLDFYIGVEKHGFIWVFYVVFIWFYVVFYGVNMVLIVFFLWFLGFYLWEHV